MRILRLRSLLQKNQGLPLGGTSFRLTSCPGVTSGQWPPHIHHDWKSINFILTVYDRVCIIDNQHYCTISVIACEYSHKVIIYFENKTLIMKWMNPLLIA